MAPEWGNGTFDLVVRVGVAAELHLVGVGFSTWVDGQRTEALVAFLGTAAATGSAWDPALAGVRPYPGLCAPGVALDGAAVLLPRPFRRCTGQGSCGPYDYPSLAAFQSGVLADVAARTGIAVQWLREHHQYLQSEPFAPASSIPNGCGAQCPPTSLDDTWNEQLVAIPSGGPGVVAAFVHAERTDAGATPPTRVIRQVTLPAFLGLPTVAGFTFEQRAAATSLDVDAWMRARHAAWVAGSTYSRIVMQFLAPLS
jgi:hypothetical protein